MQKMQKFLLYVLLTFSSLVYLLLAMIAIEVMRAMFDEPAGKINVGWMDLVGAPVSFLVCLFFFFIIEQALYKGYRLIPSDTQKAGALISTGLILSALFYELAFAGADIWRIF